MIQGRVKDILESFSYDALVAQEKPETARDSLSNPHFHFCTNKCLKSESNDAENELDDDVDVDAHSDINPGVANRELLRRGGSTAGSGSVFLRTKYVSSHAFHTIEVSNTSA